MIDDAESLLKNPVDRGGVNFCCNACRRLIIRAAIRSRYDTVTNLTLRPNSHSYHILPSHKAAACYIIGFWMTARPNEWGIKSHLSYLGRHCPWEGDTWQNSQRCIMRPFEAFRFTCWLLAAVLTANLCVWNLLWYSERYYNDTFLRIAGQFRLTWCWVL